MDFIQDIKSYQPFNEQEQTDQDIMLKFIESHPNCLERENQIAHFTVSIWVVNQKRTKTLLIYHNLYDSWAWIGGHTDGESDFHSVALRELQEETGIHQSVVLFPEIFSLEILPVSGHIKRGSYVSSHLHMNVTYLAEADETEACFIKPDENQAVKWWNLEDVESISKEPWMVEHIYKKLIARCQRK